MITHVVQNPVLYLGVSYWLCYTFTVWCIHTNTHISHLFLLVRTGLYSFPQGACKMFFSCCDGKWPRQQPSRGALAHVFSRIRLRWKGGCLSVVPHRLKLALNYMTYKTCKTDFTHRERRRTRHPA